MNFSQSNFRRLVVAAATVCVVLLFGASGAQAAPALAVGPLVAENHDTGDEDTSDEDSSEDENSDEDSEDNSDEDSEDEDNSDEDSEDEDEPTNEPSNEPTFTDPPTTDTPDITEMPTQDAGATSDTAASPLGWILLGGGVVCAAAAVAVYRRNRHIM